jgi:hypothetical protein
VKLFLFHERREWKLKMANHAVILNLNVWLFGCSRQMPGFFIRGSPVIYLVEGMDI